MFFQDPPAFPSFTRTPVNQTANEGGRVTFYCSATGSPSPIVTWSKLGGIIPSDRQQEPSPGSLRIINLQPSDDGTYVCTAQNFLGKITAHAFLRIQGDFLIFSCWDLVFGQFWAIVSTFSPKKVPINYSQLNCCLSVCLKVYLHLSLKQTHSNNKNIIGRGWAKYHDLSMAMRELNNCFIIWLLSLFFNEYLLEVRRSVLFT